MTLFTTTWTPYRADIRFTVALGCENLAAEEEM
jgi:hypothetical protein